MGTRNFVDDDDAYRDLPWPRKPLPRIKAMRRRSDDDLLSSADQATERTQVRRAPQSAEDALYFDLSPDVGSAVSRMPKGTRR